MKNKILIFLLLLFSGLAQAQQTQTIGSQKIKIKVRGGMDVDSFLTLPPDTLRSAPIGSIAQKSGVFFRKTAAAGTGGWTEIVSGTGSEGVIAIVSDVATLRTIPTVGVSGVLLQGIGAGGDGRGGEYTFDAASTAVEDGITIVKPTAIDADQPGRFLKFFKGPTRSAEFDIRPASGSQTTKITNAIANSTVKELVFDEPNALIAFNGTIDFQGKTLRFENGAQLVSDGGTNDTLANALINCDLLKQCIGTTLNIRPGSIINKELSVMWLGAKPDAYYTAPTWTDNYPIFTKALSAQRLVPNIYIPGTDTLLNFGHSYQFSNSLTVNTTGTKISGDGRGRSTLVFTPGAGGKGFLIYGDFSTFENFGVRGAWGYQSSGYNSSSGHGFEINAAYCRFLNVSAEVFDGDGFNIDASVADPPYDNANLCSFIDCNAIGNGRNGWYYHGGDANSCYMLNCNTTYNGRWGVYDNSFLGNVGINIHAAVNAVGHTLNKSSVWHLGNIYSVKRDHGPATSTVVEPGVTPGWEYYYVHINYPTNPPAPDAYFHQWDSTVNYLSGGAFLLDGASQKGTWVCYTEQDGYTGRNTGSSIVFSGFSAGIEGNTIYAGGSGIIMNALEIKEHENPEFSTLLGAGVSGIHGWKDHNVIYGWKWDTTYKYSYFSINNGGGISGWSSLLSPAAWFGRVQAPFGGLFTRGVWNWQGAGNNYRMLGMMPALPVTTDHAIGDMYMYNGSDTTIQSYRCVDTTGANDSWITIRNYGASNIQFATELQPGIVSTTTQKFAGIKTFFTDDNTYTTLGVNLIMMESFSPSIFLGKTSVAADYGLRLSMAYVNAKSYIQGVQYLGTQYQLNLNTLGGKVGIGNDDPATILDVTGDLKVSTIANLATNPDKNLVTDLGVIKHVTNSQLWTNIGGSSIIHDSIAGLNVTGGTFTPTETDITNIATSTSNPGEWIRIGDRVHYAGSISITATTPSSLCEIEITLPIASALSTSFELNGTVSSTTVFGYVFANSTTDKAKISFISPASGSPGDVRFTFTYKITPP